METRKGTWVALGVVLLLVSGAALFRWMWADLAPESRALREPSGGQPALRAVEAPLPAAVRAEVERELAVTGAGQAAARQRALDRLLAHVTVNVPLEIEWSRLVSARYAPDSPGSMVDANDALRMAMTIGTEAFLSLPNLYSTLRHELRHVQQHHDRERTLRRGWGWIEVDAYLWELEHAGQTGLGRADQVRRLPGGGGLDTAIGVPRALDGLFRRMMIMDRELHEDPSRLTARELEAVRGRVSCAVGGAWAIAQELIPELRREDLGPCPES
ncbi:MAG: hypothetical protein IT285_03510 [Bdellovibrionales bacterium]|nr:hypothetical protein [Bdellovibrionales bacterium]